MRVLCDALRDAFSEVAPLPLKTSVRYPGPAALPEDDVRSVVTIESDELSAPLRFYFLRVSDTETKELEYLYDGCEIGNGPLRLYVADSIDLERRSLTPLHDRWERANLNVYRRVAECFVALDNEGARRAYGALAVKTLLNRPRGKKWTRQEQALLAEWVSAQERAGATEYDIAQTLGRNRSSVYRALNKQFDA